MTKITREELQKRITSELITYLGEGTLNPDQLAETFDYSGLDIEDFDQLKQLHFVLHDRVVKYIEQLPERLRRIGTEQQQTTVQSRGEVRGRINWPRTLQQRSQVGYKDRTLFMVDSHEVRVDTPENQLVKKLLATISEPLEREIQGLDQSWRGMWDDDEILRLRRTLSQNVYLDALPSPEEISISSRDLSKARQARKALYYEAAELYQLYQDLMNDRFGLNDVQAVLRETMVAPAQTYKLFELFCVFALIRTLQNSNPELRLRRVQPGSEDIARLESQIRRVEVYYDEGGPLSFYNEYPKPEDLQEQSVPRALYRQAQTIEYHSEIIQEFLSRGSQHAFYNGRPDFIVLDWDTRRSGRLREVIIGEIKYSESPGTFSEGLRELLEYMYFAEYADEYVFGNILNEDSVRGVLCTAGVDTQVQQVERIQHATTEQLRQQFKDSNTVDFSEG